MHIFKHSLFRLKITVGCLVCGVVCAGVLWWCVLLCCGGACVWCVVKLGTLSLSLLFSLLPLLFPFLSLSYLSFSLFFFFFFLSCSFSYSCSCSCSFSFSSFFFLPFSSLFSSIPPRQQTLYKALINKHGVQLRGV